MIQICDICGKECINLKCHIWKAHGDGINHKPRTGQIAWNKGLTKETSNIVKEQGLTWSNMTRGKTRKPLSAEHKQKISISRKKYLLENPDQVPYLLNHSSKQSYPEKYFSECFNGLNIIEEFKVGLYSLDFANPTKFHYIEIDGEQHYVDKRILDHDVVRTQYLKKLGWKVKRIRWKNFSKLAFTAKEKIVEDLIAFIK